MHPDSLYKQSHGTVLRLLLQASGTFDTMFHRPFDLNLTNGTINELTNTISDSMNYNHNTNAFSITANSISPIVGKIFKPSASVESVASIDNGWSQNRFRYFMHIEIEDVSGYKKQYFITGYTDHDGASNYGSLDPNMVFYINSITECRSITRNYTNIGNVNVTDMIGTTQIVHDNHYNNVSGHNQYTMRPNDIFSTIELNTIMSPEYINTINHVTNSGIGINREHYCPSTYISNLINAHNVATLADKADEVTSYNLAATQPNTHAPQLYRNTFLNTLRNSSGSSSRFTLNDLCEFDSTAKQRVQLIPLTPQLISSLPMTGQFSNWDGNNQETILASMILQAMPAIMTNFNFTTLSLMSTNNTIGGQIFTQITNANSLATGTTEVEKLRNINLFMLRFDSEIANSVSFNNQISYTLEVSMDMFGHSTINISIDGGNVIPFVAPTFADNCFSSLTTSNESRIKQMANDFEYIINEVGNVGSNYKLASNNDTSYNLSMPSSFSSI